MFNLSAQSMTLSLIPVIYSKWCCLWRSNSCQWSHCGPATHYHSELSDSLPVSAVRVYSITTKLSVCRQWNMEPRPHPSGMHDDTNNNTANVSITSRYSWRIQIPWTIQKVFQVLYHWSITFLEISVDWHVLSAKHVCSVCSISHRTILSHCLPEAW